MPGRPVGWTFSAVLGDTEGASGPADGVTRTAQGGRPWLQCLVPAIQRCAYSLGIFLLPCVLTANLLTQQ